MNYLPSKNFIKRVLVISLLVIGWFYFFGGENNNYIQKSEKNKGGILVFSKDNNISTSTNSLFSGAINILSDLQKTGVSELNTFAGGKRTDYETYGNNLVSILKVYSTPDLPNEGELMLEALGSGDAEKLKEIALMSRLHFAVAGELRKLKVPEEVKFQHLFLLNDIETLSYADQLMVNAFEDPKTGMDAINLYKATVKRFMNSIIDINKFFTDQKIEFNKNQKINIYINDIQ